MKNRAGKGVLFGAIIGDVAMEIIVTKTHGRAKATP
jgi:hypothetical protein